jgi:hypothetical protein
MLTTILLTAFLIYGVTCLIAYYCIVFQTMTLGAIIIAIPLSIVWPGWSLINFLDKTPTIQEQVEQERLKHNP